MKLIDESEIDETEIDETAKILQIIRSFVNNVNAKLIMNHITDLSIHLYI